MHYYLFSLIYNNILTYYKLKSFSKNNLPHQLDCQTIIHLPDKFRLKMEQELQHMNREDQAKLESIHASN